MSCLYNFININKNDRMESNFKNLKIIWNKNKKWDLLITLQLKYEWKE